MQLTHLVHACWRRDLPCLRLPMPTTSFLLGLLQLISKQEIIMDEPCVLADDDNVIATVDKKMTASCKHAAHPAPPF